MFYAYGMVLTQSFNGAGDTWTPTIINLFVFWLWEIPLAYVLAKPIGLGPQGVFLALAIAYSTLAVVSAAVFRKGRWKTAGERSDVARPAQAAWPSPAGRGEAENRTLWQTL